MFLLSPLLPLFAWIFNSLERCLGFCFFPGRAEGEREGLERKRYWDKENERALCPGPVVRNQSDLSWEFQCFRSIHPDLPHSKYSYTLLELERKTAWERKGHESEIFLKKRHISYWRDNEKGKELGICSHVQTPVISLFSFNGMVEILLCYPITPAAFTQFRVDTIKIFFLQLKAVKLRESLYHVTS